ncbi:3-hydroxyacyl-CoA dehydrogenase NAD-binding domain-containing protein [Telmatobacter bradus]|uniref:3-hydroxyacyl-CoA dehydrogenase NAD-binding domain-containing protein n=1 Tax=Telmatobacter bradus TaxID=474953 RepID=UPI003B42A452
MLTVAIIGAGPLGRWLARTAACAGYRVLLEDVMPSNLHHAQEEIRAQLNAATLASVCFVRTLEDAAQPADLVIDCVPDELESKLEILWLLDRMAPPRALFLTPTMHLALADLAACTYRPEKVMTVNASPLAFVESMGPQIALRATQATAPETIVEIENFWKKLGFAPQTGIE